MKLLGVILLGALFTACSVSKNSNKEWVSLFDGKSLDGWEVNENLSTFSVQDGMIVVNGPRAHLFYKTATQYKNFELRTSVMTEPGSNSGIFIHTAFQPTGWPSKGYEIQVNNSHTDWRRTGSLYAIEDVKEVYVKDKEWYTEYIKVQGKIITIKINDKTVVEYTEPEGVEKQTDRLEKHLSTGTFALQGHDPKSKVYFKDIRVRRLPD